eukprot:350715-Chlamydomonas_euryale.AAC.11
MLVLPPRLVTSGRDGMRQVLLLSSGKCTSSVSRAGAGATLSINIRAAPPMWCDVTPALF